MNGQGPGATSIAAALRNHARPPSANDHELLNDFAGALTVSQPHLASLNLITPGQMACVAQSSNT